MFRSASWLVDHIEIWIPAEKTFSYAFLKSALDSLGVGSAIIIMAVYTVKGIYELFRKGDPQE